MTYSEWINKVMASGHLCEDYTDKVHEARSKKALMDVCLDSNGSGWLCEMDNEGITLPYETILKEFGAYINARYVAEFQTKHGAYSSAIYCCYNDDECVIGTTIATFLGCQTKVILGENSRVKLFVDKNCNLNVACPDSAKCIIECWDGANIVVSENQENVRIRNR